VRPRGPHSGRTRSARALGAGLTAFGATLLLTPTARAAAPIPIELDEHVDDACSSRSLAERLDESGVATVRVTHGGTVALTMDVRKKGDEFDGVLTIRQGLTPTEKRHASSPSCDEVFDALATIASIAVVEAEVRPPHPSNGDPSPTEPPSPPPKRGFHLRLGAGAELSLVGDGRGSLAIPFALRLEHARMPTLRLALMTRRTGRIVTRGTAGEVDAYLGRFDIGPRYAVARRVSAQIAWSSEVGLLSGRLATAGAQRAWWASGLSAYARLDAGSGDLELGVGAVLPILRPRFHREGDSPWFEVPVVVPWVSLCGALSIF